METVFSRFGSIFRTFRKIFNQEEIQYFFSHHDHTITDILMLKDLLFINECIKILQNVSRTSGQSFWPDGRGNAILADNLSARGRPSAERAADSRPSYSGH